MTNDAEDFLMKSYLYVILVNCLFNAFVHFKKIENTHTHTHTHTHIYIYISYFAVQQELPQNCKPTILQILSHMDHPAATRMNLEGII